MKDEILYRVQKNFPLTRKPFEDIAKELNITACLDKFSEREQLPDSETFYCSKCKEHLPPQKKIDLWSVPDVLIIHLKRFQYLPGATFIQREKIEGFKLKGEVVEKEKGKAPIKGKRKSKKDKLREQNNQNT